ncbi:hypothetical protein ABOM_006620 [Aspergillus bombycis]|uniref:Class II aldolase/adducin N-terminal domain-containing protein n=1 Tax=Aspergillus bombycis TaxID=109264 RepID=A0A1F8A094_9EURO|nr:hypothetical protein ABOM_006620 [Aspergillus bombycis]OGM45123.1 hypothetical protein ABOM_006620 [Aspergillus bombycis]
MSQTLIAPSRIDTVLAVEPEGQQEASAALQAISRGGPTLGGIPSYTSVEAQRHAMLEHMAGAFRVFARRGYDEGLAGHISLRDPEHPNAFWTNPFGRHFALLKAQDMILVNEAGEAIGGNNKHPVNAAGFLIHSALHKRRPDVHAACHMHSTYGRAWSVFGRRLDMITQDSATFFGDAQAVYDDFGGIVFKDEESEKLAQALGPKGKALILRNHGLLTVGQTVDEAAFLFTLMERCCQIQLLVEAAEANGTPKKLMSEEAAEYTFRASDPAVLYCEFQPELELEMELSGGAFSL